MKILIAILWLALLGGVLGAVLAIASRLFAVKRDERVEQIREALPGANCGGCGFAGCDAYADAVVRGEAKIGLCGAGGNAVAQKMGEIMGQSVAALRQMRACVMCSGVYDVSRRKYIYEGASDCVAAARLGGGDRLCPYGCIGLGSCAAVCRFGALSVKDGVARVDPERCTGCGACAAACPKQLIRLIPADAACRVGCMSADKGAVTRSYCNVGCIGCGICVRNCEHGAISLNGTLASIDYDKCTGCGKCAEKCPRKIIVCLPSGKATIDGSEKQDAQM